MMRLPASLDAFPLFFMTFLKLGDELCSVSFMSSSYLADRSFLSFSARRQRSPSQLHPEPSRCSGLLVPACRLLSEQGH